MSADVVLPVGHALGPLHRAGSPVVSVVRVGDRVLELDADRAVVWDLAHGLADDDPLCGAQLLLEHAAEVGVPDPVGVVAALVADGLLWPVPADPTELARAARQLAALPLLAGLGLARDTGEAVLGLPGQPVLQLPRPQELRWRRTAQAGDLWEGAQSAAALVLGTPVDEDPPDDATARELPAVVADLPLVLSHHAGFLDVATPPV